MRSTHACDSIISLVRSFRRAQSGGLQLTEARMKTTLHFLSLDDVLFVVALFAPVSVVLSGALAMVAAG